MSLPEEAYRHFARQGGWSDLRRRAKFCLTGGDRIRYLNGQVTADITRLRPGLAQPACVTTAKGKLCGDVYIHATPEALLLDAEPELREPLLARLERYIVADDVVLEDVSDTMTLFHTLGREPQAGALQARRFGRAGLDYWQSPLPTGEAPLSPELLELLRIEGGQPRWGRELSEETLPPEAGLDRTHIDYHKGCYIGQETISRLKSVGHVNRHLCGFIGLAGAELTVGDELLAPEDPAKVWGTLTSSAWSFALAKPIALGYLRRGSPATLLARPAHLEGPAQEVTVCELPFSAP